MAISDRIKNLFTKKQISNSLSAITRNYTKAPSFQPERQVTGITYKAIDKIGSTLSTYQPKVLKTNGEPYNKHPILDVYNNPNPRMSASDFIHMYGMHTEIYGETFWYLARGESTRRIKEIYLLNPDRVELKVDAGQVVGYVLHKANGNQVPLTVDEVYHDKKQNPFNEWRGLSVLEKAAVYVDTEIKTANFTLNYISNNASPSGIVTLPNMTKDAFKQFAQQWREGYEGPENAGKTAFIRGDENGKATASFQAVGATLKDIDQKVTREMAVNDVLTMLEVPKPLLGMTDDSGFGRGNLEVLELIYAKYKLEPLMKRLDRIYTELGKSFNREGAITVTHDSPVPEDKEFEHKQIKELTNLILTVNESRAMLDLEPINGGDELKEPKPSLQLSSLKTAETTEPKTAKVIMKSTEVKKQDEPEDFRLRLVKINNKYAKEIKRTITKFAQDQEKRVIANIKPSKKAFEEWLFNVKDEAEEMAKLVLPIMNKLVDEQNKNTVNWITGDKYDIPREYRLGLEVRIKQISGIYNQETLEKLQDSLTEGQRKAETLVSLKKRVEEEYNAAAGYRADRIAKTESLRASNSITEESYKQNGFSKVEWFANPSACEFCASMDGKTKVIGDTYNKVGDVVDGVDGGQFQLNYDDVGHPPLHPNCECSLIPVE